MFFCSFFFFAAWWPDPAKHHAPLTTYCVLPLRTTGSGIYFAESPEKAHQKTTTYGAVLQAQVFMGRMKRVSYQARRRHHPYPFRARSPHVLVPLLPRF